jgi:hypothetical protein
MEPKKKVTFSDASFQMLYNDLDSSLDVSTGIKEKEKEKEEKQKTKEKEKKAWIGLSGKMGTGKGQVAEIITALALKKQNVKYKEYSFAQPLKKWIGQFAGETSESVYLSSEWKEKTDKITGKSFGEILQLVGTWMRQLNENVWVNKLQSEITDSHVLFTDVRFENEKNFIEDHGGIVIRIEGPCRIQTTRDTKHVSETALDKSHFTHIVQNTSTLEDLKAQIEKLLFS